MGNPLKVAWFSFFPVSWMEEAPAEIKPSPREHPAPWQRVLLGYLETIPDLELHILSLRKEYSRSWQWKRGSVTFHGIKTTGGLRAPTAFFTDTWQIGRLLKTIKPQLVHAWGSENGASLVASRLPYPSITTIQGIFEVLAKAVTLNRYQRLMVLFEKQALQKLRHVTVESQFACERLQHQYPHLKIHQIEHAPLPDFFNVTRSPQAHPRLLLHIGRLTEAKGGVVLLQSLPALLSKGDFQFVTVGGMAPECGQAWARIQQQWGNRVRLEEVLPPSQLAQYLAAATLLIYPSLADNSPNVLKEAIVAGCPVVASRVGGIPEHVVEEKNGLLVEPGSEPALLEGILRALNHPLLGAGRVDGESLLLKRKELDPIEMGQKFARLYREVGLGAV